MNDVELAAEQFTHHVWISALRVEEFDLVLECGPFFLDRCKLRLALIEQAQIFAPRQEARRTGNSQTAENEQDEDSRVLRLLVSPIEIESASPSHQYHRIIVEDSAQAQKLL